MYKELAFELVGGAPRGRHVRFLAGHPTAAAHVQASHVAGSLLWQVWSTHADASVLDGLEAELARGGEGVVLGYEVLERADRTLTFLVRSREPTTPEEGTSIDFLAQEVLGHRALVLARIEEGRLGFRVVADEGDHLVTFFERVRARVEPESRVRLLRIGEFRGNPSEPVSALRHARLGHDDARILEVALTAGYYDEPKKVGVRELGESLGYSKSAVARRLRALERRALESLLVPGERRS